MKKVVFSLIAMALTMAAAGDALAWPRLFRRSRPAYTAPTYAAPVYRAPAPAVAVHPQEGYRSFSYEPGLAAPVPATGGYRSPVRNRGPFGDATRKVQGNY